MSMPQYFIWEDTPVKLVATPDGGVCAYALDARTGSLLWRLTVGAQTVAPMTYAVDGKQYVAVPAGQCLFVFGLRD